MRRMPSRKKLRHLALPALALAAASLALTLGAPGCFQPDNQICSYACDPNAGNAAHCPSDFECRSDGYCHLIGSTAACGFAVADLSAVADMSMPGPDLTLGDSGGSDGGADLLVAGDLASAADLALAADLSVAPDFAVPADLSVAADLATTPDLATLPDLSTPPDLTRLPDLTPPPDLYQPPDLLPSCKSGIKDQDETDVDCGGTICGPCADGLACQVGSDCLGGICYLARCTSPMPDLSSSPDLSH
jgi:hypothetical protein